jgi:hypothetical protein
MAAAQPTAQLTDSARDLAFVVNRRGEAVPGREHAHPALRRPHDRLVLSPREIAVAPHPGNLAALVERGRGIEDRHADTLLPHPSRLVLVATTT